ncbi:hypothetical protein GF322_00665 [Candidatus Dependentiae bacterium]|nr:hypothetical protein [Candidatus Dependentiae bacterium]
MGWSEKGVLKMFKLHDKVIYPGHGIALIAEFLEKMITGKKVCFFKLCFLFKDMTILVPTHNMKNSGIRYPSDKKTINLVYNEIIKCPVKKFACFDFTPSGWNRRNKEYQLKIQRGKLIEIAQVYRDLMFVSQQKELSFGEKNLLQIAEDLLVQEIQFITNKDRDLIINELQEPIKQYFFHQELGLHNVSSVV